MFHDNFNEAKFATILLTVQSFVKGEKINGMTPSIGSAPSVNSNKIKMK